MAPPNSAPQEMHESRMMAEVAPPGCCAMENVSGSRIATPLAPPRPGSTPMMTPRMIPASISITLNQERATAKPPISEWISCIARAAQLYPSHASSGPLGSGTLNQISNMRKKTPIVPMLTAAVFGQGYFPRMRMKAAM